MTEGEKQPVPVKFGAEFGPTSISGKTSGVSLSTFKSLVWISNLGGLFLVVIALELMIVQQQFWWGLASAVAGIAIALFPSNYEIVGMAGPSGEGGAESAEGPDDENT
jgi:hypothetical protein